jgi:hypothetical protein
MHDLVVAVDRSIEDPGHPGQSLDGHFHSGAESSRLSEQDTFNGHGLMVGLVEKTS